MELLFSDTLYDTEEWEEGKFARELSSELLEFDSTVMVTDTDIGHGADFPAVLVEIFNHINWPSLISAAGLVGLFFSGNKINKNIDAWIEIAKKFKQLLIKSKPTRIDEYAALLMVVNDLSFDNNYLKITEISLQVIEFTKVPHGAGMLGKRPDALYLISIKTLDTVFFIYGVKSNMKIEFKKEYSTEWLNF